MELCDCCKARPSDPRFSCSLCDHEKLCGVCMGILCCDCIRIVEKPQYDRQGVANMLCDFCRYGIELTDNYEKCKGIPALHSVFEHRFSHHINGNSYPCTASKWLEKTLT